MALTTVLCVLAMLPLQGAFQEPGIENITVVEGQNLDLHCADAGNNHSALEWKNPHWFVIFFKNKRGLRDQRYQLIHYSKDSLFIRLTNVTTHDEGLYTCSLDSVPVQRKQVNVLATPSNPQLEELRARHTGERTILKCSVWGGKPRPQITWLLENGVELFGRTKHQLEDSGKKYNSTSILKVHTCNQKFAVTCVIRHKTLGGGNLTITLNLERIKSTTDFIPTMPNFVMSTSENPQHYTESKKILNVTEGSSYTQTPSPSNGATTQNSNANRDSTGSDKILNVTEERLSTLTPSPSNEAGTQNFNITNETVKIWNITEGIPQTQTPSVSSGAATLNSNETHSSNKTLNVTEGKSAMQTPSLSNETATWNISNGTNFTYKEIVKRKPNVLLPVLVAVLLSALFIIVLLFIAKLWKAHRVWKNENDASEQTLESNRSRPNEDNNRQNREYTACWKTSKNYVIRGSCTRTSKRSEESQDSSVFEKKMPYIKETDL
ncbi:cytotoxic and regulatory T-cell molecule [Hemicordylus capensis]|uniref:cytotoxic and regulatory T-cell molecule n=1 Tax=Hemicordylus capensis TaxID=884348 RepID=UPI002304B9AD|nr:cytotoxic and regulatory T-cell molecule [Hemicordylus capensis]